MTGIIAPTLGTLRSETSMANSHHAGGEWNSSRLLILDDVGKTYRMGDIDVPVLVGVNLEILTGEFLVVAGPSGSGKSTLLNLVGGIDRPTVGSITFDGQDLGTLSDRRLTLYRRQHVGFVFQFYNLVPTLTAAENVMVCTQISPRSMDPLDALRTVGLEHRVDHFPAQLSGGEQQRVAIARAIAKHPKLLLCDEPTGALDLETGRMILQCLVEINEQLGTTTMLITHNLAIAGIAHRVVRIGSGTIAASTRNADRIAPAEVSW